MYVSWSPASGQVNAYTVKLYKKASMQLLEGNGTDLSNATVNKLFQDLKPGVVYCVVVVTKSGPVESYSETVCNATCEFNYSYKLVLTICTVYICTVCNIYFRKACSV